MRSKGPVKHEVTGRQLNHVPFTQEVFIILAKKSSRIRSGVSLAGWLYQVTRTTAIDHIRSNSKRQQRETQYSMDPSLSSEDSTMCWEELSPVIDDTLQELSESDRNLVLMRYFCNRSNRSSASSLSISEDAARKRTARAIAALRTRLTSRGLTFSAATLLATIPAHAAPPLASSLFHSFSSATASAGGRKYHSN